ncbi:MAG: alpha/beta fold hydrolase, partial [Streptosporangiaceae bacterium]
PRGAAPLPALRLRAPAGPAPGPPAALRGPPRGRAGHRAGPDHGRPLGPGPAPGDRRFTDPAWTQNPLLRRIVQLYLAGAAAAESLLADAELGWRDAERAGFIVRNLVDAAAPSNNPLISPAAWKALIDTGGLSTVRGVRALASDLSAAPRIPAMVSPDAFEVGRDLAVTPGAVVARTEICELIQYEPATPRVHQYPLVIVPPMINKFYITDLSPDAAWLSTWCRRAIRCSPSRGDPDARHREWGLDAYGQAVADALDTARSICGAQKASIFALCSGGIVSSMVAAHLRGTGRLDQLATLHFGVTVLDQTPEGTVAAMVDERTAALAVSASQARGYLDGRSLAEVFAWFRPNDLIWTYWVNNYLQGQAPPPFDILYWNADTTRMPAALHRDFIELVLDRALAKPGTATMLGSPVDLSGVDVDAYVIAGVADHLCPWQACYRTTQLVGGDVRFALVSSGHIASMVNPPGNPKARFQVSAANPADPPGLAEDGRDRAGQLVAGLLVVAGRAQRRGEGPARRAGQHPVQPLDAAPGLYVLDR